MKRNLLVVALAIAALTIGVDATVVNAQAANNDEEALTKLINEWATHTVQGNAQELERIMAETFKGSAEGISFNKHRLVEALKSGQMKVGEWTIDDVKLSVKGRSASATGRSKLSNATYMGKDFSGDWTWTDHFVKQPDGTWRAVSSQSRRIKR
jgi:hypothetical protein